MKYLKEIQSKISNISDYFVEDPLLFYNLKKTIVNLDKNKNQPPIRSYKDESTSNFVEIFFNKNEDTLNYFLFYNFQLIHYYLITNINRELEEYGEVLKSDDELFLVFKGGNVIHFYFDQIINLIKSSLKTEDQEFIDEISELNKNFKTSDVDMSVYILNNDEQKFNLIYYYVTIYLTKALDHIRNNFEKIFNQSIDLDEKELDKLDPKYFYNENDKYDIYLIHKYYREFAELFEKSIEVDFLEKLNNLLTNFVNSNNQIYIFTDIYVGSRYISILQLMKYYYKFPIVNSVISSKGIIHRFFDSINDIIKIQNDIVLLQLNNKLFKLIKFYSVESIKKMLDGIIKKFNSPDYQNKSFFNRDENPSIEYKITGPVTHENISIRPRKDFVFRNINNPHFYANITFPNENVHYISVNNAISNPIGSEHVVTFDLYRIKFNIKFNGITNISTQEKDDLNIPSEFIDVSIPKFYDFNLSQLRHKIYNNSGYNNYFSKLNNTRLNCNNVLSTNLKYTIKDLNTTLYEQSTFIPWNDNKYNKRIIRLMFIIFVSYFKKASQLKCVDLFNSIFDSFILYLKDLCDCIIVWYSDKSSVNRTKILSSIANIIYFNDETNNLLNVNTLSNFYNYQDKLFFKIRYFDLSDPNNERLTHIIHDELDLSINIIAKIAFFLVSDPKIYRDYLLENLEQYNYDFNSEADKNNYVDKVFIEEYMEFVKKFIHNVKFLKNIVFENAPKYESLPVGDLFIGGSKNNHINQIIKYSSNKVSFGSTSFTDGKFKSNIHKNKKYSMDYESMEMTGN
jgi:hypothetical protein